MALSKIARSIKNMGRDLVRSSNGLGLKAATLGMASVVGGLVLNDPSISKNLIDAGMAAVALGGSGFVAASIFSKPWNAIKQWGSNDPLDVMKEVNKASKKGGPEAAQEALKTRLSSMSLKQRSAFFDYQKLSEQSYPLENEAVHRACAEYTTEAIRGDSPKRESSAPSLST